MHPSCILSPALAAGGPTVVWEHANDSRPGGFLSNRTPRVVLGSETMRPSDRRSSSSRARCMMTFSEIFFSRNCQRNEAPHSCHRSSNATIRRRAKDFVLEFKLFEPQSRLQMAHLLEISVALAAVTLYWSNMSNCRGNFTVVLN